MRALGDKRIGEVTTHDVASFLRRLDRAPMSSRQVNSYRQVLSAMFAYACREDTYALARNPVSATNKRREMPAAVLDFYEPEEIEAVARTAAAGEHRQAV
jgi:site-specific recombinase XerD